MDSFDVFVRGLYVLFLLVSLGMAVFWARLMRRAQTSGDAEASFVRRYAAMKSLTFLGIGLSFGVAILTHSARAAYVGCFFLVSQVVAGEWLRRRARQAGLGGDGPT